MNNIHNNFVKLLNTFRASHELLYAIICSANGQIVSVSGDLTTLPWQGLYTYLFGDAQAIITLYNSLDGQILPQTFSQGDLFCAVHTPSAGYLVGLFGQKHIDPRAQYQRTKQLAAALEAAWSALE